MSEDIASKWNTRYAFSGTPVPGPADVLSCGARWLPKAISVDPSDADLKPLTALDLACGRAANGQWLAQRGFQVSAWDISETVIDEIRSRRPQLINEVVVRNVVDSPPEPESFDVIVVVRFLERALCPAIQSALKPGGILFYQTFTSGLNNPDYMLAPRELLGLFDGLDRLEYSEPEPDASGVAQARFIARRSPFKQEQISGKNSVKQEQVL